MWFMLWSIACVLMGAGLGFMVGAFWMFWLEAPLRTTLRTQIPPG